MSSVAVAARASRSRGARSRCIAPGYHLFPFRLIIEVAGAWRRGWALSVGGLVRGRCRVVVAGPLEELASEEVAFPSRALRGFFDGGAFCDGVVVHLVEALFGGLFRGSPSGGHVGYRLGIAVCGLLSGGAGEAGGDVELLLEDGTERLVLVFVLLAFLGAPERLFLPVDREAIPGLDAARVVREELWQQGFERRRDLLVQASLCPLLSSSVRLRLRVRATTLLGISLL